MDKPQKSVYLEQLKLALYQARHPEVSDLKSENNGVVKPLSGSRIKELTALVIKSDVAQVHNLKI